MNTDTAQQISEFSTKFEKQKQILSWVFHEKIRIEYVLNNCNLKEKSTRALLARDINNVINKINEITIPFKIAVEIHELKCKIMKCLKQVKKEQVDKGQWKLCKFKNEATLPAGSYYVGDISYVLTDNEQDWNSKPIYETVIQSQGFHTNGKHIIGVYHTGDDGVWEDNKGRIYGVDGGNIGIVPAELCNSEGLENFGKITMNNEFKFGWKGRKIYLEDPVNSNNSFEIDLDRYNSDNEESE